jgi:hypothetical protein
MGDHRASVPQISKTKKKKNERIKNVHSNEGLVAVQQIKIVKNDFEKKQIDVLGLQVLLVELFDCF